MVGSIYQNSGPASLCCSLLTFLAGSAKLYILVLPDVPLEPLTCRLTPSAFLRLACNGQLEPSPAYHPNQSSPPSALVRL